MHTHQIFVHTVRANLERTNQMSNVAQGVRQIVARMLDIDLASVTPNTRIDTENSDAMRRVELFMAFEEEFGCAIPDEAAERILTVKDAIEFIQKANG